MTDFLWLMPIGLIAGVLGSLIGRGGFVLMPILLFLYKDWPPQMITAVSLAMICANSISGSLAYAKMKRINYRAGLMFAAAAVPGSIIGAMLINSIPRKEFNAIFAIAMILISLYLLV